jgi:hypothetical protein
MKRMTESVDAKKIIIMCTLYKRHNKGKYPEAIYISNNLHVPDGLEDWCKKYGIRIERTDD